MIKEKRYIPIKFDLVFKRIFGNELDKRPIKYLIETILGIKAQDISILNSQIIGSSYYDKNTTVDLIVELEDGTKIVIEVNTKINKHLINRNLFYMFKIMSKDIKKGVFYNELNKHIQINFDFEGKHSKAIMKYKMKEEELGEELTDIIEIIRIDVPYFVEICYTKDASEIKSNEKFIGLLGIEEIGLARKISKGDKNMEDICKKAEDFSNDEEIIGAYDGEWHRKEVERLTLLEAKEQAQKEGHQEGIREGIKEGIKEGIRRGIKQEKIDIAKNMLKEKIDINIISKVTDLSIEEIDDLNNSTDK